ncbi:ribose 5-phosphate isomerase [Liquorilactobacillus mali KCTC 3596 = DSM 20444]|uniref:ribose-5-phosphate isomerase n=2 Tax=Liquorilactobacillus mali TaxID=1618 RepID=A0A0R2EFG6_9LACO|nr:ribose-5-phosphate isomerase A [Liquorilactobacillus mali]KRN11340.1 ribose 5-phosphate isomerase [Liquorilactobacillus mali KCTC 3596 = DSM 20444]
MIKLTPIIKRALTLIKPNMNISLGGGSNVANLANALAAKPDLNLTICTPSELTRSLCESLGITVADSNKIKHLDLAFDGCDSLDINLNALKSNGGIHLFEKINAELADRYIILAPLQRVTKLLNPEVPLTLEIVAAARATVLRQIEKLNLKSSIRMANDIAGYARTPLGNLLVDCYSSDWSNISEINSVISQQNGVIATSFFENLVTLGLTFDENGKVHEFRKED